VFTTFLKFSIGVSFYSSGCLTLLEAFVPVALLPPSGVGVSLSDCCSRVTCIDRKEYPLKMIKLDRNMSG
jgi:hypothetical protein